MFSKLMLKLQSLPEKQKKKTFFTVMTVIILIAVLIGAILTKNNIVRISKSLKSLNFSSISIPQHLDFTSTSNTDQSNTNNTKQLDRQENQ